MKKDIKGLQLVSRFALPPNSLGYCGRDSAPEKFKECFINGKCTGIEEEVTKFIVLNPYLQTIAEVTGLPFCSYKVVECYWLGNELVEQFRVEHYNLLLENFLKQGVPPWFVNELREKQPKRFIPTHLFQVIHVGVGKASGVVPFNLESINSCMIRWGKVTKINEGVLVAELNSTTKKDGKYSTNISEEEVPYNPAFFTKLKVKDTISVHWKQPIKILTTNEVKRVETWTKEVLKTVE